MHASRLIPHLPIVALVGRTNVGKSTLFNRIVETRHALVSPVHGTTRSPNMGIATWRGKQFSLIDTGGLFLRKDVPFEENVAAQVATAVREAHLVLLVVDLQGDLLPQERELARLLQKQKVKVLLVGNKADNSRVAASAHDKTWLTLGLGAPRPVSAVNGVGVGDLLDDVFRELKRRGAVPHEYHEPAHIPVAIVGKPNVGKSSLLNAFVGEERVIVSPIPHTTRESYDLIAEYQGTYFRFVDTAGIRKQAHVEPGLEHAGVRQAMHAIEEASVALLIIDAQNPASTQEKKIARLIEERQKSLIIVVNKWDLVPDHSEDNRLKFIDTLHASYPFLQYAPIIFISALTGWRVHQLFPLIEEVAESRRKEIPESELTAFLHAMVHKKLPLRGRGARHPKILALRQAATDPPTFAVSIKVRTSLHDSYLRFLERALRETFGFVGTPVVVYAKKVKV